VPPLRQPHRRGHGPRPRPRRLRRYGAQVSRSSPPSPCTRTLTAPPSPARRGGEAIYFSVATGGEAVEVGEVTITPPRTLD